MKSKLIAGTKTRERYKPRRLKDIVGKTIEAIVLTHVAGPEGPEECIRLLFTDGTRHGFVLRNDIESGITLWPTGKQPK